MTGILLQKKKWQMMEKKKLRGLLMDFWKQSQGNRNVGVATHKQSMQHPEPKLYAPRPGVSTGSPGRKESEAAGHMLSVRLIQVTSLQVQEIRLK